MIESFLYEKLNNNNVKCLNCNHFCVIKENKLGLCGVRQNFKGKLQTLNYGKIISQAVDPIEKKPLFHFLPGSATYSIAASGCNFHCANCQNWEISQVANDERRRSNVEFRKTNDVNDILHSSFESQETNYIEPLEIINQAKKSKCKSISYTYTEPTIFIEYALMVMKLAKKEGLKNIWVSNGYMSRECLNLILPYLDAVNVDLKFFSDKYYKKICGGNLQPILDNLKFLVKNKIHLEITTLLIPGLTDLENQPRQIADFIANELSPDIPWHISRFSPEISFKMQTQKITPIALMDNVYEIGKMAGLNYIYVGNVYADDRENTFCPKCRSLNIQRIGYQIKRFDNQGKCFNCNYDLKIF